MVAWCRVTTSSRARAQLRVWGFFLLQHECARQADATCSRHSTLQVPRAQSPLHCSTVQQRCCQTSTAVALPLVRAWIVTTTANRQQIGCNVPHWLPSVKNAVLLISAATIGRKLPPARTTVSRLHVLIQWLLLVCPCPPTRSPSLNAHNPPRWLHCICPCQKACSPPSSASLPLPRSWHASACLASPQAYACCKFQAGGSLCLASADYGSQLREGRLVKARNQLSVRGEQLLAAPGALLQEAVGTCNTAGIQEVTSCSLASPHPAQWQGVN